MYIPGLSKLALTRQIQIWETREYPDLGLASRGASNSHGLATPDLDTREFPRSGFDESMRVSTTRALWNLYVWTAICDEREFEDSKLVVIIAYDTDRHWLKSRNFDQLAQRLLCAVQGGTDGAVSQSIQAQLHGLRGGGFVPVPQTAALSPQSVSESRRRCNHKRVHCRAPV